MLLKFYRDNDETIKKLLFILGFAVFVYFFIKYLFGLIAPFVFGYLYSLAAEPLVRFMSRRLKIRRSVCALVCVALLLFCTILLGVTITNRLIAEAQALQDNIGTYMDQYNRAVDNVTKTIANALPTEVSDAIGASAASLIDAFKDFLADFVKQSSINMVSKLPMLVTDILITLISGFFFIKDRNLIVCSLTENSPSWMSNGISALRRGFSRTLTGYLKALAVIWCVTAAICTLGLTIMQSHYSLLLGLILGFLDALPIVGSSVVFIPWSLLNGVSGDYYQALGHMIILGCMFLTHQILEPKLVSSQIGIHPLITLTSIYVGFKVLGVPGILAGPVIAVTAKIILEMPRKTALRAINK